MSVLDGIDQFIEGRKIKQLIFIKEFKRKIVI